MVNCNEIGSEFWIENLNEDKSKLYVLSGRTAIDLILQDILASGSQVSSVYMPAWCCESMLQPFYDRSFKICFYDMLFKDGQIEYKVDNECNTDIFFFTNYFGFNNTISEETIRRFKKRGCIVIYDRTHSLFQEDSQYVDLADYSFASIRKWLGVPCGAYVSKKDGSMIASQLKGYPYLSEKMDAMKLKANYILGEASISKQIFLDKYNRFSHLLVECYRDFKMDDLSLYLWNCADKDNLKIRRQANTAFLQTYLKELPQIHTMFQASESECCLFVPVLFETKDERNRVRNYLISHSIYCPIHWPKPHCITKSMYVNDIFDRELSLICDQRYHENDMSRILNTLREALDKN